MNLNKVSAHKSAGSVFAPREDCLALKSFQEDPAAK